MVSFNPFIKVSPDYCSQEDWGFPVWSKPMRPAANEMRQNNWIIYISYLHLYKRKLIRWKMSPTNMKMKSFISDQPSPIPCSPAIFRSEMFRRIFSLSFMFFFCSYKHFSAWALLLDMHFYGTKCEGGSSGEHLWSALNAEGHDAKCPFTSSWEKRRRFLDDNFVFIMQFNAFTSLRHEWSAA